jgi:hypothetical protein
MTAEQRRAVAYWSGGGVLRWNQIERELVARFNLPPAPRPDGGYPRPTREPVRRPAVPLRQPAVRGARVQLRERGAVRGLKAAWHWTVPLQPSRAPRRVGRRRGARPGGRSAGLPLGDAVLSAVTGPGDAAAALPRGGGGITRRRPSSASGVCSSGRAHGERHRGRRGALAARWRPGGGARRRRGMRGAVGTPAPVGADYCRGGRRTRRAARGDLESPVPPPEAPPTSATCGAGR